jgi:hypothetical protein
VIDQASGFGCLLTECLLLPGRRIGIDDFSFYENRDLGKKLWFLVRLVKVLRSHPIDDGLWDRGPDRHSRLADFKPDIGVLSRVFGEED